MIEEIRNKAKIWTEGNFDEETKKKVNFLLENDEEELIECFYKDLEFGTGGMRGIMGVGSNRMNVYTVGKATQGLCNYLISNFTDLEQIKVAIAYDCRNNNRLYSETIANIFSANKIKVYLFEDLRPTPELSFAIRELGCQAGIVVTASHNPKEYNGYKVYWEDGGQIIAPHDKNIINEVNAIQSIDEVKFEANTDLIESIGEEMDVIYLKQLKSLSLSEEIIQKHKDISIVYSPIHGTGVKLVPESLKAFGFTNITTIKEQEIVDGNFPTVHSPNPEEASALAMALNKAKEINADLVMATDPDADRVGIAVRNLEGEIELLNGNQTGAILIYYLLSRYSELNKYTGKEYIVKTIVTSNLLSDIANKFNVEYFNVLTGFKFIADIIKQNEGKKYFIGGGEESYGYLAGEFVRDKDAVMACALIAEAAAWAKEKGKSLYELLIDIYVQYGFYLESLTSVVKKGKKGAEEIENIVSNYRNNPPKFIDLVKVTEVKDYLLQKNYHTTEDTYTEIALPKANVIQFILEDESVVTVRPSGTEPKIKYYFSIKTDLKNKEDFYQTKEKLVSKIDRIKKDLKI